MYREFATYLLGCTPQFRIQKVDKILTYTSLKPFRECRISKLDYDRLMFQKPVPEVKQKQNCFDLRRLVEDTFLETNNTVVDKNTGKWYTGFQQIGKSNAVVY